MVHCNQSSISHRDWDIMRHLLDKHIPRVNALDKYFGKFWGGRALGLCHIRAPQLVALSGQRPLRSAMYHVRTALSVNDPSLPPARAHGTRCRSAYVTLGYHWLPSTNIWKHTCSPSRFETTAHLWHLWFICAVYKFTYTYLPLTAAEWRRVRYINRHNRSTGVDTAVFGPSH